MPADPDREFPAAVRDCPDCHELIVWARTTNDQWMPLDATPTPNGNVVLYAAPGTRWPGCTVLGSKTGRDALTAAGKPLYLHHRLSCPYADRWARTPGARIPTPPRSVLDADGVDTQPEPQGLF